MDTRTYSFRVIPFDSGIEENQILGESYRLIKSKAKEFKDIFAAFYKVNIWDRDDYYGQEESGKPYTVDDLSNPTKGRGLTGNLEYDKRFFWVDAAEAFSKGYQFIYAGGEIHFLESATRVVPHDLNDTYAFISIGEDKVYPVKKFSHNYIVHENGTTYARL